MRNTKSWDLFFGSQAKHLYKNTRLPAFRCHRDSSVMDVFGEELGVVDFVSKRIDSYWICGQKMGKIIEEHVMLSQ